VSFSSTPPVEALSIVRERKAGIFHKNFAYYNHYQIYKSFSLLKEKSTKKEVPPQ